MIFGNSSGPQAFMDAIHNLVTQLDPDDIAKVHDRLGQHIKTTQGSYNAGNAANTGGTLDASIGGTVHDGGL